MFDFDESSFSSMFDSFHDKESDSMIIEDLLNEIKKYDVYDFIANVAALNLIPENQNKSILLDCMIGAALTIHKEDTTSKTIMSCGRFKSIISKFERLNLRIAIDPPENPFIERVMFYGNYNIFTGINYSPSYTLQMLISTLFLKKNTLDKNFLKQIAMLINMVLEISNSISKELQLDIMDLKPLPINSNIIVPDKQTLEKLKGLVSIKRIKLESLINYDSELLSRLYSDIGSYDVRDILSINKQPFFGSPFLINDKGGTIILDITVLSSFVLHHTMLLADKYKQKDMLINLYNDRIWLDCRKSFKRLGHRKIKEEPMDIVLVNKSDYKELLLNVANNQFLIVIAIFDKGEEYTETDMFGVCPCSGLTEKLEARTNYLYEKLQMFGIPHQDIFQCNIINSFGRSMKITGTSNCYYSTLGLNPFELKCISINEYKEPLFLPRYISCKNKLHDSGMSLFIGELNSIEIYVSNEYSFYVDDKFNPRKNPLYIPPGDSLYYILRAIKRENRHLVDSYEEKFKTEVILDDESRSIYIDALIRSKLRASLLVEFENIMIWIYTPEIKEYSEMNLYFSFVDAISYWLSECKTNFEKASFKTPIIYLKVVLTGEIKKYYLNNRTEKDFKDTLNIVKDGNKIVIELSHDSLYDLNCKDVTGKYFWRNFGK